MTSKATNQMRWLNGFILVGLCIFLILKVNVWSSKLPWDFYQVWAVGQAVRTLDVSNIYSHEDRVLMQGYFKTEAKKSTDPVHKNFSQTLHEWGFAGTPFLYSSFYTLARGQLSFDYHLFRLFSLFAYISALLGLTTALKFPLWLRAFFVILFTQFYRPFHTDVMFANVGQLQVGFLCLILLSWMYDNKWIQGASGFLLACLVIFKPTLVFVVFFLGFYWISQWRNPVAQIKIVGLGLGTLFSVLYPMFVLDGKVQWGMWYRSFPDVLFQKYYLTGGFFGKLFQLQNVTIYFSIGIIVALFFLISFYFLNRKAGGGKGLRWKVEWVLSFLGIGVYLLTSPTVHSHYFLLMVLPALYALRPSETNGQIPFKKMSFVLPSIGVFFLCSHPIVQTLGWTAYNNHSLVNFLGVILIVGPIVNGLIRTQK